MPVPENGFAICIRPSSIVTWSFWPHGSTPTSQISFSSKYISDFHLPFYAEGLCAQKNIGDCRTAVRFLLSLPPVVHTTWPESVCKCLYFVRAGAGESCSLRQCQTFCMRRRPLNDSSGVLTLELTTRDMHESIQTRSDTQVSVSRNSDAYDTRHGAAQLH